ncbi:MAG: DUF2993 domain-containing protein [Salinibacterium sp.]|nr:MAG: DUF2993 domain-containing protein [Salinibacterium sp.]
MPEQKRPRGRGLIALVVVLVLLLAAAIAAELIARQYAASYIRERVVSTLGLAPDAPVNVDFGGGSIILQAAGGSIDNVTIRVDAVLLGDVKANAVVTATHVPLDENKPIQNLDITATISERNVRKLAPYLSGYGLKSIDLGHGVITINSDFTVFVFSTPVSVDLVPSAHNGAINFDPKTVTLGGQHISVTDLRNNKFFSAFTGDLLDSRDYCVANYLPKALTVTNVKVVGSKLVVTVNGDGTALADPDLAVRGTCQ